MPINPDYNYNAPGSQLKPKRDVGKGSSPTTYTRGGKWSDTAIKQAVNDAFSKISKMQNPNDGALMKVANDLADKYFASGQDKLFNDAWNEVGNKYLSEADPKFKETFHKFGGKYQIAKASKRFQIIDKGMSVPQMEDLIKGKTGSALEMGGLTSPQLEKRFGEKYPELLKSRDQIKVTINRTGNQIHNLVDEMKKSPKLLKDPKYLGQLKGLVGKINQSYNTLNRIDDEFVKATELDDLNPPDVDIKEKPKTEKKAFTENQFKDKKMIYKDATRSSLRSMPSNPKEAWELFNDQMRIFKTKAEMVGNINIVKATELLGGHDAMRYNNDMNQFRKFVSEHYNWNTGKPINMKDLSLETIIEKTDLVKRMNSWDDKFAKATKQLDAINKTKNKFEKVFRNIDDIKARMERIANNCKAKGMTDPKLIEKAMLDDAMSLKGIQNSAYIKQVQFLQKAGKLLSPVMAATMLYGIHLINTAPMEQRGELFARLFGSTGAAVGGGSLFMAVAGSQSLAKLGIKLGLKLPGGPLVKVAGVVLFGFGAAILGDNAIKELIDNNPKIKKILDSEEARKFYLFMKYTDPGTYIQGLKDDSFRHKREEIIAKDGDDGWDKYVEDKYIKPLMDNLGVTMSKLNDPITYYCNLKKVPADKIDMDDFGKWYSKLQGEVTEYSTQIMAYKQEKRGPDLEKVTPEYAKQLKQYHQAQARSNVERNKGFWK